jgi:hypothetical protein
LLIGTPFLALSIISPPTPREDISDIHPFPSLSIPPHICWPAAWPTLPRLSAMFSQSAAATLPLNMLKKLSLAKASAVNGTSCVTTLSRIRTGKSSGPICPLRSGIAQIHQPIDRKRKYDFVSLSLSSRASSTVRISAARLFLIDHLYGEEPRKAMEDVRQFRHDQPLAAPLA